MAGMPYAPATPADVDQMLATIGVASVDDLFADIPDALRFRGELDLEPGIGEQQLVEEFTRLAARNVDASRELGFLGFGAYDHFVPAVCQAIASRSEFATAYTPYQPEISQGTLQAIFEVQTAISELAGLPVSNASLYDGATAAAEAMYLAEQTTGRSTAVVAGSVHPHIRGVLRTYAHAYGMQLVEVDVDPATGTLDPDALVAAVDADTACVLVQQPNVFGRLEPAAEAMAAAEAAGAVGIVSADPLSLGVLEAPGNYGAGIVVGDGQSLGNGLAFGGPSFGFMAAADRFLRRMPGRIVGETVDLDGSRAYVLTLQTREQHIRREKATSNICTNQALNALVGTVYLGWLGPVGLERLGALLVDRAAYARELLTAIPGVDDAFAGPTFKEFAVRLSRPAAEVVAACKARGVHPGHALAADMPWVGDDVLLVACTEQHSDEDIQRLAATLQEVL
jgi:glycine dehydrogenase subunit 1